MSDRPDGLVIHRRAAAGWAPALDPRLTDLIARGRNAGLATVAPSGAPQLAPVWYAWDGDAFLVGAARAAAKVASIRREPRIALCIDDEPGGIYVTAMGPAELVEIADGADRAPMRDLLRPLLLRYIPDPAEADAYWAATDAAVTFVAIRLRPERLVWFGGVAAG